MDENTVETESNGHESGLNIRGALEKSFDMGDEIQAQKADTSVEPTRVAVEKEIQQEAQPETTEPEANVPRAVAPPRDMNAAEREAFLNPTAENAHILQAYLSRRSYETQAEYDRKRAEVDKLRSETEGVHRVYKKHENEYKELGLTAEKLTERSIEWDLAMKDNPIQTALEWLDGYGVRLDDLYAASRGELQGYQPVEPDEPEYLTKEEAEKVAEAKIQAMIAEQQQNYVAQQNLAAVQSFMQSKPLFTATDAQTAAQLEEKMAPIVSALTQQNAGSPQEILETAYNYVVKGDPVFSSLAGKLEAATQIPTKTKSVQKAKAASRAVSGSVGSGSPRLGIKDLRENLRRRLNGLD